MSSKSPMRLDRNHFILMFFAFSCGLMLASLMLQQERPQEERPVVVYRGIDHGVELLPKPLAEELRVLKADYRIAQQSILETAALTLHLSHLAKSENLDLTEASKRIFDYEEVTDDEVSVYFIEHQDRISRPYHAVKDEIASILRREKKDAHRKALIENLVSSGDLMLNLH